MSEEKLWLFDGSNFGNWRFRIEVLMEDKDLLDHLEKDIDEDFVELDADSADEKKRKKKLRDDWMAKDRKCKNLLVHRIAEDQLEYVKDKKTAKEAWEALKNAFERVGIAGKLFLRKQFQEMRLKEGGNVKAFLLQFDKVLREMKAAGVKTEEEDVVCQLLLALPKSYEALITALETIKTDELTLDYVKKRLLDEQVKRSNSNHDENGGDSAFAGRKIGFKCYGCHQFGHKRADCPENRAADRKEQERNPRGKFGRKQKGGANVANENEVSFIATTGNGALSTATQGMQIQWFLDSGATDHMLRDKSLFEELHPLQRRIQIAVAKSGQMLVAEYAGTVRVNMLVNGMKQPSVVNEVLYVPDLQCNLFSVRRLEDNGMMVTIGNGKVAVEKNGRTVCTGRRMGQLYALDIFARDGNESACSSAMATKTDSFDLWHRRYGHLGEANMKSLWKHGMVETAAKIQEWPKGCICEVCLAGKQTRNAFEEAVERRSRRPLELVHSDVCGPFTPATWNRKRYYVTFIDDFSHFTAVYLLESKDEVQEVFERYHAQVTAFFGVKVARLRCDNGGEYSSKSFRKFCRIEGIQLETTVPYTPQQNGVAERMNRTLLDKSRAMLQDAGLPKSMWGEAVLTAAYILNRSPTSAIEEMKTPFEMWYGRKPNIDKLRVFGSAAYTWVPKEKRSKLDSRSEKNVMVGYTTNGYRIWDPRKKAIIISRDVVFDEQQKLKPGIKPVNVDMYESDEERISDGVQEELQADDQQNPEEDEQPIPDPDEDEFELEEEEDQEETTGALPSQPESDNCPAEVITRRSERERKLPGKFLDYITSFGSNSAVQHYAGSSEAMDESVMAYALNAESFVEDLPSTIDGLKKRSDWPDWRNAINSELESLRKNQTWELVPKPPGKNLVDCKWVFKIKRDEDGNVERYKARLVAKGYSQRKGFDYEDTYAPVAKITTVRVLLAVANQAGYFVHQMDVKTAFLNGLLKEEIYMRQPDGLESGDPQLVCCLKKSLYGLKQAPRSWNEQFSAYVLKLGFKKSNLDSCLYWRKAGNTVVYLLLYVDDIILVSSCLDAVAKIKTELTKRFEMTDMGELKHYLGLKVDRDFNQGTMKINQPKYITDLLRRFGMADCNPVSTPLEPGLKLDCRTDEPLTKQPFRELIGCLTYLALSSRPDICAAVSFFSKFQAGPTDAHWTHLKRVLRYLKGSINLGLVYQRREDAEPLLCYADADWGNDKEDRKSISGNVFQVYGATVSWMTRKQTTVALSSTEAEYVSLSQAMCEAIWLRNLMCEFGTTFHHPVPLFEDNQACIRIAEEPRDHKRMKHVDIRYNFIREKIQDGLFKIFYVPTNEQAADIFTKPLPRGPFQMLRTKLGLFG